MCLSAVVMGEGLGTSFLQDFSGEITSDFAFNLARNFKG